tara:strand:+ start:1324 stop:1725 length:402 start_codon:yes stop_codon:yes gene_type:complete
MQKKMGLPFIIKIKICILIIFNYFLVISFLKFLKFKLFITFLEKTKISKNPISPDKLYIAYYESKLSKIFGIKKCLISAASLFRTYKKLGYKVTLFIGVNKEENFSSHAWIEIDNFHYLDDFNKDFKTILKVV